MKMNKKSIAPLVSIIMPARNVQRYIGAAIVSVMRQTYENWELLVLDDGSRDGTGEIVKSFAKRDSRIFYLPNKVNIGAGKTRNEGVKLARGQWIAFLDSDDMWQEDKLKRQMALADERGESFLFTGSCFMDGEGRDLQHRLTVPEYVTYRQLLKQNVISCSSVLIAKEILIGYPMPSGRGLHEDFVVWLQILRNKNIRACGIDLPLLIYRVSRHSRSGNKFRAAAMTFRVYRYIGLSILPSLYYFVFYVIRSIFKYWKLYFWRKN